MFYEKDSIKRVPNWLPRLMHCARELNWVMTPARFLGDIWFTAMSVQCIISQLEIISHLQRGQNCAKGHREVILMNSFAIRFTVKYKTCHEH